MGLPHTLAIRRPDDFHVHFRRGAMLENVLPHTAEHFGRALVMPNTDPPILTGADAHRYQEEILGACGGQFRQTFEPLMTIQIVPGTTPAQVREAKSVGVIAGKIYPRGLTTNSENGVVDYTALTPVYEAMQTCGMVLSLHGESPDAGVFCLDREARFLDTLKWIVERFPSLQIVLEHTTTAEAVKVVLGLPVNVAATITVHHLFLTLDDVAGGKLKPHYFCKPLAKRPEDRAALIQAALSGNPKFFLGTDSAPHPRQAKECAACSAGIFTAPVALPLLAQFFSQHNKLDRLENFTSVFGASAYGLPSNAGTVTLGLTEEPGAAAEVPAEYGGVVPFTYGGGRLAWRVFDRTLRPTRRRRT